MSDWNYEDNPDSCSAERLSERLREINRLLMGLHSEISAYFHPEAFLTILETLHETKEIILDIENTFFSHRRKRAFRAMFRNVTSQKKEEKKSDEE